MMSQAFVRVIYVDFENCVMRRGLVVNVLEASKKFGEQFVRFRQQDSANQSR
jgi:hypothetical protein